MTADTVVIGGGAAGMLAAATAAEQGQRVCLLEPNRFLGRKLRITGKGRCNVTNDCSVREFMENVPCNSRFLYGAVSRFSPEDAIAFFESLGLPLKTERGNRVFPVSDSAGDVVRALEGYVHRTGVRVVRAAAREICTGLGAVTAVRTDMGEIACRSAILCTGGLSYPLTGSTGDGYRMASALGHTIVPARASLVPLESDDDWCAEMQGFSLRNVTLSAFEEGKLVYRELGEMLFTHFGVSGPLVLSASAHMRALGQKDYRLSIDLKPALDEQKLDAHILRDFSENPNREFKNVLGGLAGRAMIPVLVRLSGIPGETKVHSVTREQRRRLVELFKAFPVHISAPRPIDEAIITSGGVSVREVDPKTMASRLVQGLYFAGEVLDVDAYTGGFNLQIAWSTARAAGYAVCEQGE